MRVLVACEESQRVCIAFRNKGHEAYSCDIQPCSGGHPEWHILGDCLDIVNGHCSFVTSDGRFHFFPYTWDLIIAHPPCTYLANTGNKYFSVERYGYKALERQLQREYAYEFFLGIANANCAKICIENPIGYMNTHYRKPDQIIEPWHFGHPYTKATCLWLKGLRCLTPLVSDKPNNLESYAWDVKDDNGKRVSWSSNECKKIRSKTFPGIANAMAEQWG